MYLPNVCKHALKCHAGTRREMSFEVFILLLYQCASPSCAHPSISSNPRHAVHTPTNLRRLRTQTTPPSIRSALAASKHVVHVLLELICFVYRSQSFHPSSAFLCDTDVRTRTFRRHVLHTCMINVTGMLLLPGSSLVLRTQQKLFRFITVRAVYPPKEWSKCQSGMNARPRLVVLAKWCVA